jgi:hypothetical protein
MNGEMGMGSARGNRGTRVDFAVNSVGGVFPASSQNHIAAITRAINQILIGGFARLTLSYNL